MHPIEPPVEGISPVQLKALLRHLANPQTRTAIRLEIKGKTLPDYFSTVLVFEEHALLLTHLPTRSVLNVPNLDEVTGFMVDQACQIFLPLRRYMVKSESVNKKVGK
jgi:hypothetical protein